MTNTLDRLQHIHDAILCRDRSGCCLGNSYNKYPRSETKIDAILNTKTPEEK